VAYRLSRISVALIGCLAALGVASGSALGDSSTISSASRVVSNREQFGNLASVRTRSDGLNYDFWRLPVITGDRVRINWDAAPTDGEVYTLDVFQVRTTDATVGRAYPFETQRTTYHDRQSLSFVAPRTGLMPLEFFTPQNNAGGLTFTARILHRVDIQLTNPRVLPSRGVFPVAAHNPDGRRVTDRRLVIHLQEQVSQRRWRSLGRATPSRGHALIRYRLPAGHTVRLRAIAQGGGYFRISTGTRLVHVG
jgi:hypothetical protein